MKSTEANGASEMTTATFTSEEVEAIRTALAYEVARLETIVNEHREDVEGGYLDEKWIAYMQKRMEAVADAYLKVRGMK